MFLSAKVTSKGQLTLPKAVRNLLKVDTGSVVVFEKEDDKVVIKSAKTLREFKGFLKGRNRPADFDELRTTAKEHIGRKAGHGQR